jgi:cold shock CspA family protein
MHNSVITGLTAGASALLLGALVTELCTRLWPDNALALLLATTVALFVAGLLNARLATARAAASGPRTPQQRQRNTDRAAPNRAPQGRRAPAREPVREPIDKPSSLPQREDVRVRPTAVAPGDARVQNDAREQGTVKWFSRTKGFGFIIRADGSEVFVHQRSIRLIGTGDARRRPLLNDGQTVTYLIAVRDKGPQAEDVMPVADRGD